MEFSRFELSNGIRVVAVPTIGTPFSIQIWFSCGSRTEPDNKVGLAHFIEHMFFKGGEDFPDMRSVNKELWLLGENHNAGTGKEAVFYYIVTDMAYARRATHLLSDVLRFGRMNPKDVKKRERRNYGGIKNGA